MEPFSGPLITPDAIELAVLLGANDLNHLCKVFGLHPAAESRELWDGLSVLTQAGRLTAHVHHGRAGARTVWEASRVIDFSGGAS